MFHRKFQELMPGRPLILGHRGSPRLAPENSLESFRIALESGADGIELDVQRTADGVLVAHHDGTLATGELISQMTYDAISGREKTATLDEVFVLVSGRGLLNVELKAAGFEEEALDLARSMLPKDSFAFSSFDPSAVRECRKIAPDVPAFLIVWGERDSETDLAKLKELDASGIAYEEEFLTETAIRLFRRHEIPVFVWTVNNLERASQLAAWEVTGIITDIPAEMVAVFNT